jgi:hypothetical protein
MPERTLGQCMMQPVNQVGEHVKFNPAKSNYIISKKGSLFTLSAYSDGEDGTLSDFRHQQTVAVTLRIGDAYLICDFSSRQAVSKVLSPGEPVPENAIFHYVKRKFDSLSVSFAIPYGDHLLWLRHSNSKLRVWQEPHYYLLSSPSSTR